MPSTELLAAFFAAAAVFAYMPGPALVYTAAQTLARGRATGLMAALGLHVGGYVHVAAATLGVASLLEAVPTAYAALKLLGAAYLIYLGVRMLTESRRDVALVDRASPPARSPRRAFLESVTVEALNPKTALFFLAFLPQFTDPAAALPVWVQLLALGSITNVLFSSADVVCVWFASTLTRRLRGSTAARAWLQRAGGMLFIGLGVRLATQRGA